MTKPVTRKMAVDCLLWRVSQHGCTKLTRLPDGELILVFICTICGEPILPGQVIQFDHTHADVHGGGHTFKDLRPVHYDPCHKEKTTRDIAAKAKGDRILGLTCTGPKRKIPRRPFAKRVA